MRDFGESPDADDALRLDLVIDALMRYEHIKSLTHVAGGGHKIVRLIPVSSVGSSFAQLDPDGRVSKLPDGRMRPMNVEVPLCAVVPDLFSHVEQELDEKSPAQAQSRHACLSARRARLHRHTHAAPPRDRRGQHSPAGVRDAAALLFLDWLAPRPDATRDPRKAIESEMATRQQVIDDFKRTLLKLEVLLPHSELSRRW